MGDIVYRAIQEQLEDGWSAYVVAKRLNFPIQWVEEVEADLKQSYDLQ